MMRRVAVTGATGFLGRHIVRRFIDEGWRVRILARRDPIDPLWADAEIEVVPGDLDDCLALQRLCDQVDVVVHAAGLTRARRDADFFRINTQAAERIGRAIAASSARGLLVSSLAAREPSLSAYADSKRQGEAAMAAHLPNRLTTVRPTAVYGPGDREITPLFVAAARGAPLPILRPEARVTLIEVGDLARAIVSLASTGPTAGPMAIADARVEGYGWREIMQAVARSVGRRPRLFPVPDAAVSGLGAVLSLGRLFGAQPILTRGKARELTHADWSISPGERGPMVDVNAKSLETGFAGTVAWARRVGKIA